MNKSSDKYAHLEATRRVIGQLNSSGAVKKKSNPLILIALIIVLAAGGYYVYITQSKIEPASESNTKSEELIQPTEEILQNDGTDTEENILVEITGESDENPRRNVLYLVQEDSGEYALFVTNEDIDTHYDDVLDKEVDDPYFGLIGQGEYVQSFGVDYREFTKSIRLSELSSNYVVNKYFSFVDHFISDDNKYLYISLVYEQVDDAKNESYSNHNVIIKVDLDTKKMDTIWSREIGDDTYGEYLGAVTLRSVVDGYIEANMLVCYNCAADSPGSIIIINMDTGKDVLLGDASKITFDISGGEVSYEEDAERKIEKLP